MGRLSDGAHRAKTGHQSLGAQVEDVPTADEPDAARVHRDYDLVGASVACRAGWQWDRGFHSGVGADGGNLGKEGLLLGVEVDEETLGACGWEWDRHGPALSNERMTRWTVRGRGPLPR